MTVHRGPGMPVGSGASLGIAQYDLGTTFKPGSGDPIDGQPL
jgi:hypothetical protein